LSFHLCKYMSVPAAFIWPPAEPVYYRDAWEPPCTPPKSGKWMVHTARSLMFNTPEEPATLYLM
jgi:hypothetical protein